MQYRSAGDASSREVTAGESSVPPYWDLAPSAEESQYYRLIRVGNEERHLVKGAPRVEVCIKWVNHGGRSPGVY